MCMKQAVVAFLAKRNILLYLLYLYMVLSNLSFAHLVFSVVV